MVKLLGLSVAMSMAFLKQIAAGGIVAQVADANDFCMFLPPPGVTGMPISDNEWDSQAYCMGNTPLASGANTMPAGLILSAHYVATDAYVQVTGQIDPTKAGLLATDEGGQCDIAAPQGSSCAGWTYYVNLIEPVNNVYCMRCCNDPVNCNRGISQAGCARIVPGDYSGPLTGGSGLPSSSANPTSSGSSSGNGGSSASSPGNSVANPTSSSFAAPSNGSPSSSASAASSPSGAPGSASSPHSSGAKPSSSGSSSQQSMSAQSVNSASSTTPMNLVSALAVVMGLSIFM
ncbi:hypothetical protein DM01DRAFT_1344376 [Hesseltinella vesiculosa]|uniref:Secreted protein n=1 Tax=Hesseltinella vesiculosa TaxID=101127 RepID=A0A1X2GMU3_9FUNG|nr:hypothetical protein DM01DRAFT_1344376 [Hesseltinella vesiculosa]